MINRKGAKAQRERKGKRSEGKAWWDGNAIPWVRNRDATILEIHIAFLCVPFFAPSRLCD
jgi:hypothetical protein